MSDPSLRDNVVGVFIFVWYGSLVVVLVGVSNKHRLVNL